ncbi:DUF6415 family natural product biosynthesis protein [Streptomyces sp. NPDC052207]|uniref:DUF6415 family natural product biosynthesis protein n=1 Tax=Streptomyces sp. NPDC052207 TaxID=3155418 RepID=UPI00343B84AA
MTHATAHRPPDSSPGELAVDPVAALIVEAFDAGHSMPPHERLVEVDQLLRKEIERLVPLAREHTAQAEERTRTWYALMSAADSAAYACRFELGSGRLAGALHVAELARRVIELRRVLGVDS